MLRLLVGPAIVAALAGAVGCDATEEHSESDQAVCDAIQDFVDTIGPDVTADQLDDARDDVITAADQADDPELADAARGAVTETDRESVLDHVIVVDQRCKDIDRQIEE